jgi:hypothetical protein
VAVAVPRSEAVATWGGDVVFESTLLEDAGAEQGPQTTPSGLPARLISR